MSVAKTFGIFSVARNATWIDQMESSRLDPGVQEFIRAGSGSIDALLGGVERIVPVAEFTTSAVASALGMVGIDGVAISGANTLALWLQQRGVLGATSGLAHTVATLSNGVLFPTGIRAGVEGAAMMSLAALGISADGSTSPLSIAHNSALTHDLTTGEEYRAGPWTVDGTAFPGIVEMDISLALDFPTLAGDGDVFPTLVYLRSRLAQIVLRTVDVELSTSAMAGNVAISGTTKGYLRKRAAGTGNVANATAQHISFTVAKGNYRITTVEASDGSPAFLEIVIQPIYNGTNPLITVEVATAIT